MLRFRRRLRRRACGDLLGDDGAPARADPGQRGPAGGGRRCRLPDASGGRAAAGRLVRPLPASGPSARRARRQAEMTAFRAHVRRALADPALQQALDRNAERRRAAWGPAFASLPPGFVRRLEANKVVVPRAATASDACRAIVDLLHDHGAQRVVKAKSMVTEEIGLNHALMAAG